MKKIIILFTFFVCGQLTAQNKGLLPYTGAIYEKSGISFEEIELKVEDERWISNILPIGKKLQIKVKEPIGFVSQDGLCFPGISIFIAKSNGDTIGFAPNIFEGNEGFEVSTLSNLSFSFSLKDSVKIGDKCKLEAIFFDTKGERHLSVKLNFSLGQPDISQTSNASYSFSSSKGYRVNTNLEISDVKFKDTLIKNEFFQELKLEGLSLSKEDLNQLNEKIIVYSSNFSIIESSILKNKITINKNFNPTSGKYDLFIYSLKNKNIPEAYLWNLKLENNAKNQIIEILNTY